MRSRQSGGETGERPGYEGMGLGLFIGASNNAGEGLKNGLVIGATLFMAFVALTVLFILGMPALVTASGIFLAVAKRKRTAAK